MNMHEVILVDEHDNRVGVMEKMEAHMQGLLHRAFSIFLFNGKGQILLQRRAISKYHSPGLWTNTCCSHPMDGESIEEAANRRLMEEMGMSCVMVKVFDFIYKADLDNNLVEHEFDHVFFGTTNDSPVVNSEEVEDWKWMSLHDVYIDVQLHPANYTEWFKIALPMVLKYYKIGMS
ncbi:MAG: isopentenyl-diphosphate Delta-isomerase [Flavobacteriales bacterium]